MWISHRKGIRKLMFRALAFRRSESRNCGCVWFIYRNMEPRYWLMPGNVKSNGRNKLNKKRSLAVRIKSADLKKNKFLFYSFEAFCAFLMWGEAYKGWQILVVLGTNLGFWSHLGCWRRNIIIFSCRSILRAHSKKSISKRNALLIFNSVFRLDFYWSLDYASRVYKRARDNLSNNS